MKGISSFIADLAGAIYDFCKVVINCLSYFIAGMMIVGIPLYLIAKAFEVLWK